MMNKGEVYSTVFLHSLKCHFLKKQKTMSPKCVVKEKEKDY